VRRERGIFTFVEVLLATMILALAATATAYWVETVNNLSRDAEEQTIGLALVRVMESIVTPLAYREPGSTNFGPEPGEQLADFDDVDDFAGFAAQPPLGNDLAPQAELVDWRVAVTVVHVDPDTLAPLEGGDVRRVTVTAEHKERPVAEVYWLRTRSPKE
jgi:hypothetical protein